MNEQRIPTGIDERDAGAPDIDLDAIEVATPKAIEALQRAEIDMQIATAKKYPRVMSRVLSEVETMACVDQETADRCFYRLKRKDKDGKIKWIVGESVRFAEIVLCAWGNVRHGVQIIDTEGDYAVARATVHDLEKNGLHAAESVRQIVSKDRNGKLRRYSTDMIQITAMAAASIALRNATFRVIPRGAFHSLLAKIDDVASGKSATIEQRRAEALKFWAANYGLTESQVCAIVERAKATDLTREDLSNLRGLARAVKDGETTLAASFPELFDKQASASSAIAGVRRDLDAPVPVVEPVASEAPARAPAINPPIATALVEKVNAAGEVVFEPTDEEKQAIREREEKESDADLWENKRKGGKSTERKS